MSEKLKIVYRPLQELSPYAHNARTHSTEQVAQLVESIKQFGWTNPVLIDEKGEIIAGHGRVMAAEMLKMDSVPVIVLSGLTDEQKKAYRLADNRLPMNAGWDEDLLRMELSDLINADFDVSLTGFIPTEIDELLTDVLPGKFKAYIAGFGSGKTWVGCGGICKGIWEHPGINQGYFAPTYPQIRDIFYPTVEEVAADWGLNVKINEGNKEVHFYYGRQYRGTTICRSMEKPQTIVGFKIGNALVDELDILPKEKARTAWRKIIARMRYKIDGLRNGIDVTTTPEGFKFVYEQFVKAVREKTELASLYGLVQASTFDNEKNLPADYIPSLLESYPPELIKAYLRGQFTNLTSGTVYHQFDRKLNNCEEVEQPGEPIYIGMDFNVGKMAGIVHVLRLGLPCAVTEIINAYDTPDMIRIIKERFWLYDGNDYRKVREIYIYPDASGDSRKSSNASTTDIAQLKQAGFNVVVNSSNPPVKDRVNSMNAMFCNANGERRYKVNVKRCPLYAESLEQQVWDEKGEPDKKSGNDHPNDAGGYFIVKQFPIVKPTGRVTSLRI